jgi:hypothetical protein
LSSKTNSTVEVNGTSYDARSGKMLSPKKLMNKSYGSSKKLVDGFVVAGHHQAKKVRDMPAKALPKAENLHKRAQQSTTLMRHAVKKPTAQTTHETEPAKRPSHNVPAHRQGRAKTVERHAQVNRFGFMPNRAKTDRAKPTEVIKVEASYRDQAIAPPRPPSMVTSASHKKLEQLLDEALVQADAHKNMMKRTGRVRRFKALDMVPRWLGITSAIIIIIAVAFWLLWQNLPAVAVHVAAARAHVNAAVPTYTPEGFSMAKRLEYNQGAVTLQFKDKSDKSFTLTQKASDLNSAALPSGYLPAKQTVQTSMIGGTTVYIYGDQNNAAWVNHGVLYKLNNSAGLPADQVLKIVQGL